MLLGSALWKVQPSELQAIFNWSAPSDTGGTPIDDYTILILVGS